MKKILLLLVMCAASMMIVQSARAAGIGVYGTVGVNFSTWYYRDISIKTNDYFYGCGLAIDSNVAKNEVLGYRFMAGYTQYRLKDPDSGTTSDPIHRADMSHTLSLALAKNENLRFWVGPRFGLHYLCQRKTYTEYVFMLIPEKVTNKLDMIGLDALLAFGINMNMGDAATMFFDFGLGYMGNYSTNDENYGHGFGIDAKIGFMFRINDTFISATGGSLKQARNY